MEDNEFALEPFIHEAMVIAESGPPLRMFSWGFYWLHRGDIAWAHYCFTQAWMNDDGVELLEIIERPFPVLRRKK